MLENVLRSWTWKTILIFIYLTWPTIACLYTHAHTHTHTYQHIHARTQLLLSMLLWYNDSNEAKNIRFYTTLPNSLFQAPPPPNNLFSFFLSIFSYYQQYPRLIHDYCSCTANTELSSYLQTSFSHLPVLSFCQCYKCMPHTSSHIFNHSHFRVNSNCSGLSSMRRLNFKWHSTSGQDV